MKGLSTKKLITAAITGALYAALTMWLSPLSYGPLQLRVSEALCVLPFFLPYTAWGLFFGCAIANIISAAGILDVIFGSMATLISCLLMAAIGRKSRSIKARVLACGMPALCNGLIVGAVLSYAMAGLSPIKDPSAYLICVLQVAAGELAVLFAVGLPLMSFLLRQNFFARFD